MKDEEWLRRLKLRRKRQELKRKKRFHRKKTKKKKRAPARKVPRVRVVKEPKEVSTTSRTAFLQKCWKVFSDHGTVTFAGYDILSWTRWNNTVTRGPNWGDWRRRIANSENATTPLHGVRRSVKYSPGQFYAHYRDPSSGRDEIDERSGILHSVSLFSGLNPNTLDDTDAKNKAIVKFNQLTQAKHQSLQSGVILGELSETLHGIRHPAQALRESIDSYLSTAKKLRAHQTRKLVGKRSIRDLNARQKRLLVRETSKALSGLWLERSFHWLPLLHDVDDAVKTLANAKVGVPGGVERLSATAHDRKIVAQSESVTLDGFLKLAIHETELTDVSVTLRGAVKVSPQKPGIPHFDRLGFALRDFVPTAWELLPYSWAIDYFTNVGDIINGYAYGGLGISWAAITTRREVQKQIGFDGLTPFVPSTATLESTVVPPSVVSKYTDVTRSVFNGPFVPSLAFTVPGMSLRWLNLGALITQRNADALLTPFYRKH